jgi:hypothetical protein
MNCWFCNKLTVTDISACVGVPRSCKNSAHMPDIIFTYRIQTIVATVIPYLTTEFHRLNDVAWYSSVLLLTVATTQGIWGKAFKYFDIKLVYLLSIFIFELGSLICGEYLLQSANCSSRLVFC